MAKPLTRNPRPGNPGTTATSTGGLTASPASLIDKVTNTLLMVAVERDGVEFIVNTAPVTFFVPSTHANYAAMVSMLISAQSGGATLAVKYPKIAPTQTDRREPIAIARGVHAVISGGSF